ncbi:MAG TPA: carboxypeptidase regulatory-like domain-containing protein [Vicinamibacterales bacterium]|nr:carboxypeptidase regulatory-like domain-containing protein [Vicinamibacterales bacterium]
MKWLYAGSFSLVLAACLGVGVAAQNVSSSLTGVVKDSQDAVLPGVTVTATSPALIGSQTAVTESNGTYRFPSLPPGTYTLTFEIPGFQKLQRPNIVLALSTTLTIDATLQLATVQESVQVTAASPVVDVSTTAVGNTLNADKLFNVPSSSDLWGALAQAPGITMQGFDVGGSHKSQQTNYITFGVQNQNRVVTEGVDTTEGTGGAGFYQDYYAQDQIAVSGAGQDVSMNTPGAAITSQIKSGGNRFAGMLNQAYEPSHFVGDNATGDSAVQARGGSANPNILFWETHADLGGPIATDKAWFYGAFDHFHIDKVISGVPQNLATDLGVFNTVTTKETYKPTQKDTLIGFYEWSKKQKPYRGLSASTPSQSTLAQTSPSWMYNGKWQRVWSNRFFSELNVGEFGYDFPERPSVDYTKFPPTHDLGTGLDTGAGWFNAAGVGGPFDLERAKPQVFATATYFLPSNFGSHDLKFGYEWRNDMETYARIGTSGPVLYETRNGAPAQVVLSDTGDPTQLGSSWTVPIDADRGQALFAQDRWTANQRVTVTAGVRYDRQQPYYTSAVHAPLLTSIFPSFTSQSANLKVFNNVAPRLGVAIDPMGDGKTAVKAFYGRYYFNVAQTFANVDPGGLNQKTYVWTDPNGNGIWDGPQENGQLVSSSGGSSTTYNANMPNSYTDEIDLSVERQFWGESSLRLAYVRKMLRDEYGAFNTLWNGQFTVPYTTTLTLEQYNAANPKAPTVTGTQTVTLMDIPTSLKGHVQNVIDTLPNGADQSNYDTVELAFNKRFTGGLFVFSAFDWTRNEQYNLASGASTDPLTQSNPLGLPGAGGATFNYNPNPNVPFYQPTSTWAYVLSGRYVTSKLGIGIAPNFRLQSGWNYAPIANVVLPNAGSQFFFLQNLTQRSDNVAALNVRVDKRFDLSGGRGVTVMLDMYNILNANPVDNFFLTQTGSTYNQIIGMLDPRTFQIGFRVDY